MDEERVVHFAGGDAYFKYEVLEKTPTGAFATSYGAKDLESANRLKDALAWLDIIQESKGCKKEKVQHVEKPVGDSRTASRSKRG